MQRTEPARPDQPRTRRAKRAVLVAAQEQLVERGYVATSIADISAAAGVPVATVYRLFSSKVGILKAVLDVAIAGDDEDVPLAARAPVRVALDQHDPAEMIAGFVAVTMAVNGRISELYRVLSNAADADPEAARYRDELDGQRRRGQGLLADALAESGALRADLDQQGAADIVHALLSPEIHRMLVVERRWAPERCATWLTSTLAQQLLDWSS